MLGMEYATGTRIGGGRLSGGKMLSKSIKSGFRA
jgi:hypothetical protein